MCWVGLRASVHIGNNSSGARFALGQDCSSSLLKVESPVWTLSSGQKLQRNLKTVPELAFKV